MKTYYKILSLAALITAATFSSCTKEDGVFDSDDTGGIIELADLPARSTSTSYSVVTKSFDAADEVTFPVTINYTGSAGAPQDITLTMSINSTALSTYNTAQGTSYTELPTTLYSVDTYTVTILKGSKTGTFNIKLKTSAFDFSLSYALGISIQSATSGTISGNYGTGIFRVVAKNAYEASYTVTGWFFHPTAGRAISSTKSLTTVGVATNAADLGDLGSSDYNFTFDVSGSALSNFVPTGSTPTGLNSGFFTTDQPGASGSWVNSSGTAQPGTSPWLHTTYNNSYDEANQTFYMHYGYVGSGGAGESTWSRQVYEKWVRK